LYCFLKINYVSNIKLRTANLNKPVKAPRILYSRRFVLFFFFFNLLHENKVVYIVLYKPISFQKFNILRAPYKNKIAQNSYAYYRYNYSIYFEMSTKASVNLNFILFLRKYLKIGQLGTNVSIVKSATFCKFYKLQILKKICVSIIYFVFF
jgi:hypothetical protein